MVIVPDSINAQCTFCINSETYHCQTKTDEFKQQHSAGGKL